jgi:hypothetical protein
MNNRLFLSLLAATLIALAAILADRESRCAAEKRQPTTTN